MMNWMEDILTGLMEDLKRAYKSWTIIVNGIAIVVLEVIPYAVQSLPDLQDYLSPEFYKHAMTVLIVVNLILRFKTKSALRDK